MNKVYLSGVVSGAIMVSSENEKGEHVEFDVQVRHKTSGDVMKKELYRIHCWNRLGGWAKAHLTPGKLVAIEGYLTQKSGICIAAKEIVPGEMTKRQSQSAE